jgi:hypothetical protein
MNFVNTKGVIGHYIKKSKINAHFQTNNNSLPNDRIVIFSLHIHPLLGQLIICIVDCVEALSLEECVERLLVRI